MLYPLAILMTMCLSSAISERGRITPLKTPFVLVISTSLQTRTPKRSRTSLDSPLYPLWMSPLMVLASSFIPLPVSGVFSQLSP